MMAIGVARDRARSRSPRVGRRAVRGQGPRSALYVYCTCSVPPGVTAETRPNAAQRARTPPNAQLTRGLGVVYNNRSRRNAEEAKEPNTCEHHYATHYSS